MVNTIIYPAALVVLGATIKSFVVHNKNAKMSLTEMMIGLPVDLTYVIISIALCTSSIKAKYLPYQGVIAAIALVVVILQIGAIYKPCREYMDDSKNMKSFGLWLLNALITYISLAIVICEVLA